VYRPDLGVTGDPFHTPPEPRLFHADAARQAILAALDAAATEAAPIHVVVGEAGSGKSLLLRVAAERLASREDLRLVPALGPLGCSARTTFDDIARACRGGRARGTAAATTAAATAVVMLDDVDRLKAPVMARLRRFQAIYGATLGPIVLVVAGCGLPAALGPLRVHRVAPMAAADVRAMIDMRLAAAGEAASTLFMPDAIDRVFAHAMGNPGRTLQLCTRVLALARHEHAMPVLPELVDDAAARLWPGRHPSPAPARPKLRLVDGGRAVERSPEGPAPKPSEPAIIPAAPDADTLSRAAVVAHARSRRQTDQRALRRRGCGRRNVAAASIAVTMLLAAVAVLLVSGRVDGPIDGPIDGPVDSPVDSPVDGRVGGPAAEATDAPAPAVGDPAIR
jgi:hypothetical protein